MVAGETGIPSGGRLPSGKGEPQEGVHFSGQALCVNCKLFLRSARRGRHPARHAVGRPKNRSPGGIPASGVNVKSERYQPSYGSYS